MSGALHGVPHPSTESGALKFTCEPCTPILFGGFNLTFLEPRTSGAWSSCSTLRCTWQPDPKEPDLTLLQQPKSRLQIWSAANNGLNPCVFVCVCVCVGVCDPNRCVEKYEKSSRGRPWSTSCVAVIQSFLENVLVPALPCGVYLQPRRQRRACEATCRPHFRGLI